MDAPPVTSKRLDLVWMSPEFMQAIMEGRIEDGQKLIGADLPALAG